jgi:hypothetical protein
LANLTHRNSQQTPSLAATKLEYNESVSKLCFRRYTYYKRQGGKFTMLRELMEMRGFDVRAQDGDVGTLHDLFFDDETWTVRYFVVDTGGWLTGRRVLVSPTVAKPPIWDGQVIPIELTKEMVENSPEIDLDRPVSQQQLIDLHEYYGWPAYWGGPALGGTGYIGPRPPIWPASQVVATQPHEELIEEQEPQGDPHLRSVQEVVNYDIEATDGEIGHVADLFADEINWTIEYLLLDTRDWLPGREVLVAPSWVENVRWTDRRVVLEVTKEQVKESPEYDPEQPIARTYETRLFAHYGYPGYWDE